VVNYTDVFEQLEAAYYVQVILPSCPGITTTAISYPTDIRDHEMFMLQPLPWPVTRYMGTEIGFNQ
jgi:hypothetical protein